MSRHDRKKIKDMTMMELMAARHRAEKAGDVGRAAVLRDKILARLDSAQKLPSRRIDR